MTKRTKKRIEVTWTIIGEEFHDSWPTKEEAQEWVARNPPEGKWRIAKMVEANPAMERLAKAALALREFTFFDLNDHGDNPRATAVNRVVKFAHAYRQSLQKKERKP